MIQKNDILVIGARGIPNVEGGAEKNAEKVFPILASKGFKIKLLGIKEFIRDSSFSGVELEGVSTFKLGNSDKIIYNLKCLLKAIQLKPRIVHLQGLNAALFLVFFRLFGIKTVLRYSSADHLHQKWGLIGRFVLKACEAQLKFADLVIVVSENYQRDLIERLALKNVYVIPNGVDDEKVPSREDIDENLDKWNLRDRRFILSVGRITVDKGFDKLIETFKAIDDNDIYLVIVGGISEKKYWDYLKDLSNEKIYLLGRLRREELKYLYASCSAYVNCSYFEGLSNSLLEAISFNRPIIASDITANREMELREESYYALGNSEELMEKILKVLVTPEAYVADKNEFRSWVSVAEELECAYADVSSDFKRIT